MVIYEKPLWLGCTPDLIAAAAVAFVVLTCLILFVSRTRKRLPAGHRRDVETGILYVLAAFMLVLLGAVLLSSFPPEIVRIALSDGQIELRSCHRFEASTQRYAASDIEFGYERRERRPYHVLVIRPRAGGDALGALDFLPPDRFNFAALRELAPAAVRAFERRHQR